MSALRRMMLGFSAALVLGAIEAHAGNLLRNADFERVYAAQRRQETDQPYLRREHQRLPGYEGEPFMPYGWALVPEADGQGVVSRVFEAERAALRIRLEPGERIRVRQQWVELLPGADCRAGIEIRGEGLVRLLVQVQDPAPREVLVSETLEGGAGWQRLEASATVGPHRRLAGYFLDISGPADLRLRGARLDAGTLDRAPADPFSPASIPQEKVLFYEGFDAPEPRVRLNPGARLTEDGGGWIGRGLEMSDAQGGSITPLEFGDLPERGTIEFWYQPSELPLHGSRIAPLSITTQTPGMRETRLRFDFNFWFAAWGFGFSQGYTFHRAQSSAGTGWGWWQPGTWHHVAGSWDGEVFRVYVDGVLDGVRYGKDQMNPRGVALDLILNAPGVIDEIRITGDLIYGPAVPEGMAYEAYQSAVEAPSGVSAVAPESAVAREPDAEALDTERAARILPVPETGAAYEVPAVEARPAWEGMPGLTVRENHFGEGVDGLEFDAGTEPGRSVYWRLDDIEAGDYYVGLWVESGNPSARTEVWPPHLITTAYRNGWPIRFQRATDPVQVAPGRWLVELQTADPVTLAPGDEIAFAAVRSRPLPTIFRLALHREEPSRGHEVAGRTFGVDGMVVQRLRLVMEADIRGPRTDGAGHVARISVANPLPYAVEADVTWSLSDYFGEPLAGSVERVSLDPHAMTEWRHEFVASGDAQAYQLSVRSAPASDFVFPFPRPEEWLDLGSGVQLEFLPNQPDPLTVWTHARLDLLDDRTGGRRSLLLDGSDWEWAFLDGRLVPESVPEGLEFRRETVPYSKRWVRLPPDRFGKWFRKRFVVPDWMAGERYVLEITEAESEATVFLNGRRIGGGVGSSPIRVDLGNDLAPGQEVDLLICVRGAISLVDPDFVEQFDMRNRGAAWERQDVFSTRFAPPGLNSVWLHAVPRVRVRQNVVIADTRERMLRIFARLENLGDQPREVTLTGQVFQNGRETGVSIPESRITVPAGETVERVVEAAAADLRMWTPQAPYLAELRLTVLEDGKEQDTFRRRFGYRDVRIEGARMLLNDQPVRMFGTCHGFNPLTRYEMDNSFNFDRMDADEYRDLYDEIGHMHLGLAWVTSAQHWPRLNNDRYWESWNEFLEEAVWEKGSRPGVVGWLVSCEQYSYTVYTAGREGQELNGERIFEGVRRIRDKFWPHYWALASGDGNLGGRLDFYSFHYMTYLRALRGYTSNPEGGFGNFDGVSFAIPDGFYLNKAAHEPRSGTVFRGNPGWEFGASASGSTEDFEFHGQHNGSALAKFIGDRATASSIHQFFDPRGMAWTLTVLDGHRDMDKAVVAGVYWRSFYSLAYQAVAFSVPERQLRYYGGARFDRRLNLYDDEYDPGELDFRWRLLDSEGRAAAEGSLRARSTTSFLGRERLLFDLPEVAQRTAFTLEMDLWKDGSRRMRERRHIEVWPRRPAVAAPAQGPVVHLFDPAGTFEVMRDRLGLAFQPIATLDAEALAGARMLVVAPDAASGDDLRDEREAVQAFARAGGRVLILRQDNTALLPDEIRFEPRAWFSQLFVRTGEHPVLQGLGDLDFEMWNPGHYVSKGAFHKPDTGTFLALLDAGHESSMDWTPMLELFIGQGSILATQMDLTESWETEPLCAELMNRLLAYLDGPAVLSGEGRPLSIWRGATEAVLGRLQEVRADYVLAPDMDADAPVTLIDLSLKDPPSSDTALRAALDAGATLWIHRARPEHREFLEQLTGRPVRVEVQPYRGWVDRQKLVRRDGLVTGLNNLDLYWREHLRGHGPEHQWQVSWGIPLARDRGQVQYVTRVADVSDYLFPGGLVEIPVANGRVVLDQLRWEGPSKHLISSYGHSCGSPERVLSMLLNQLGIARRPSIPRPVLPRGVRYEPMDLSAFVNRGIRDDQAGDGIGWKDWGPEADLRDFPTGEVRLGGVPYRIAEGEHNAILLRVNPQFVRDVEEHPAQVAIPLHRKNVAGLYFLHTSGWAGGETPFGYRIVEYADGSRDTQVLNARNMADWNPGRDNFPDEEITTTTTVWKGANPMYPVIRVYHTLWVNPHPEREIARVILSNEGLEPRQWRFIPHLGITAVLLPAAAPAAARDPERSQALLQEALALQEAGRTEEAAGKLEAALVADDRNAGVWMVLAGIRARTDTVDAFVQFCARWIEALPENYQAYNVLGAFLEQKERMEEAFAAYHASLNLEPNQPPIAEALNRVLPKIGPGE